MNIQKLLEESRERTLRIKEQKIEEENEKYRLRNIHEAEQIINSWKREFKRIKKNKIRISVRREYNSYFDRFYYKLRCFVDGKLYEDFNLEQNAGVILTSEIQPSSMGGFEFYSILNLND